MRRRQVIFDCEGAVLLGSLDEAAGTTGLLLVTGGNEVRSGAWAGQAMFAARIAAAGFPVFRFDRRGVGDSEGANGEFRASGPDLAAALACFRRECPQVMRVVALGNCDAASALMLAGGAGCDALVLSNPWTTEQDESGDNPAPPPPEAVRAHYRQRLADPAAIKRLLTGKVNPFKLLASLRDAAAKPKGPSTLAQDMAAGIAAFKGQVVFLLASRDRTAQVFLAAWNRKDKRLRHCEGASHSFVEPHAREWLEAQVLEVLRG